MQYVYSFKMYDVPVLYIYKCCLFFVIILSFERINCPLIRTTNCYLFSSSYIYSGGSLIDNDIHGGLRKLTIAFESIDFERVFLPFPNVE